MKQHMRRPAVRLTIAGLLASSFVSAVGDCAFAKGDQQLHIFALQVPRDYRSPSGPRVPIQVGVAAARRPDPHAEPIFVVEALAESGVEAATRGILDSLGDLRASHDVVLIDQRGVSIDPLLCPSSAGGADGPQPIFDKGPEAECRDAFIRHAKLGDLNSRTFAEDVEAVRQKLGYPKIDLISFFYGTRIAQQYLARWPGRVTAAVLADVSPMDHSELQATAEALPRSVASALDACRLDAACHAHYPNLESDWLNVAQRLSRGSISYKTGEGVGGATEVGGKGLLEWLKRRTLRWQSATTWPSDVHSLVVGDAQPLIRQYLEYRKALTSYPMALRIAVDCAENLPPPKLYAPEIWHQFADETASCPTWPITPLARFAPTPAMTPILAVTADFDIEGAPVYVGRAFAGFSNTQLVVFRNRARATDFDWPECLGPMVTQFLESHGRAQVDAKCADQLRRPPFVYPR